MGECVVCGGNKVNKKSRIVMKKCKKCDIAVVGIYIMSKSVILQIGHGVIQISYSCWLVQFLQIPYATASRFVHI